MLSKSSSRDTTLGEPSRAIVALLAMVAVVQLLVAINEAHITLVVI